MNTTINENFVPQERDEVTLATVGFWPRFWAFSIDLLIIALSGGIIFHLFWPSGLEKTLVKAFILINPFFPGIWGSLYFVIMTKYFGQTMGKMIVGIRVVAKDGGSLSWLTVVMREFVGRIICQLLGTYLVYLGCIFHPQKETLGDIIGGTYVVYGEKNKKKGFVRIPTIPKNAR